MDQTTQTLLKGTYLKDPKIFKNRRVAWTKGSQVMYMFGKDISDSQQ